MARRNNRRSRRANNKNKNQTIAKKDVSVNLDPSVIQQAVGEIFQQGIDIETLEINLPDNISQEDTIEMYRDLLRGQKAYEELKSQVEGLQTRLQKQEAELEQREIAIVNSETDLDQRQAALHTNENKHIQAVEEYERLNENLQQLSQELKAKEIDLGEKELRAEAGFLELHADLLGKASAQVNAYQEQIQSASQSIQEKSAQYLQLLTDDFEQRNQGYLETLTGLREQVETFLEEERARLNSEHVGLEEARVELQKERDLFDVEKQQLEFDRDLLNQQKDTLAQLIEEQAERRAEAIRAQRDEYQQRLAQSIDQLNQKNTELQEYEFLREEYGSAQAVNSMLKDRLKKYLDLRRQVDEGLSEQELTALRGFEAKNHELQGQLADYERKIQALDRELRVATNTVLEHENLRDKNRVLQSRNALLTEQLQELETDIQKRLESGKEKQPFEICSKYDIEAEYQQTSVATPYDGSLAKFAEHVQGSIASQGFYYSIKDIRSFIAGMAMSRLMILQGISGTGKTSLPVKFIQAITNDLTSINGYEVIEVQAGWRDRDDLVGYYNAFEKRFYEKKMLKALYRAQCPAFKNRVFIIVLDEMNLSSPEQYFADFLSALERKKIDGNSPVDLLSASIDNPPVQMKMDENGLSIKIPDNVWFVGTANRDETTRDIADKTYDRSHVMELPAVHPTDISPNTDPIPCVSVDWLLNEFDTARSNYDGDVDNALDFFDAVKSDFGEHGIGWGNRLKAQIEAYIPVVRATGGSLTEAVDYILAMKVLRKTRDRYDLNEQVLLGLQTTINESWEMLGYQIDFVKSSQLIETEIRKKQNGIG